VIRDGVVLGDTLMALFAFPPALKNPCYLFEYSGHLCFTVTSLPLPSINLYMQTEQPGVLRYVQTLRSSASSI